MATQPIEIVQQKNGVKLSKALPKVIVIVGDDVLEKIEAAKEKVEALEVNDQDSYNLAGEYQKEIALVKKGLNATHKDAKSPFKMVVDQLDAAKKILADKLDGFYEAIGGKMGDHLDRIERENAAVRAKALAAQEAAEKLRKENEASEAAKQVEADVEAGRDPFAAPVETAPEPEPVQTVIVTEQVQKVGGTRAQKKPGFRLLTNDLSQVPERYIIKTLDETLIKKDIRDGKLAVQAGGLETKIGEWIVAWLKTDVGSSGRG